MKKTNLATKLTLSRIFGTLPVAALYVAAQFVKDNFAAYLGLIISSAFLMVLCFCTDFMDGYVARKTGTVTDLGKFLDPLADKIAVVMMMFLIVCFGDGLAAVFECNVVVIAVLSGLILSREIAITVLRGILAAKGVIMPADIYGKVKTVFLNIAIVALMLAGTHKAIGWIGTIIYYIGAVLAVYSGINYYVKSRHLLRPQAAGEEKAEDEPAEVPQTEAENN